MLARRFFSHTSHLSPAAATAGLLCPFACAAAPIVSSTTTTSQRSFRAVGHPSPLMLHRGLSGFEREQVKEILKEGTMAEKEAKEHVRLKRKLAVRNDRRGVHLKKKAADSEETEKPKDGAAKELAPPRRVASSVVDSIIFQMNQKGYMDRYRKGELTKEERDERSVRRYIQTKNLAYRRARSRQRVDPSTPLDHLPIRDLYEYSYAALRGGEIASNVRHQIPMALRMITGERSLEVPPPSFIYVLLQSDPNLLHESYHPRITFAVEQWLKLPEEKRQYFVDNPLKGISE